MNNFGFSALNVDGCPSLFANVAFLATLAFSLMGLVTFEFSHERFFLHEKEQSLARDCKRQEKGEGGLGAAQTMGFQEVICMHSGRRNACWELEFNYL